MSNFINACLSGDALLSDIDNYIDEWHESDLEIPIYLFLGMSKKEYELFVHDEIYLASIVTAHREGVDVDQVIQSQIAMAARSDDQAKSLRLQRWLKEQGLW